MPFTPMHMGPGMLVKALLQGGFSLMVFGYAQVVMDLQPLFVLITGEGHLHGFSHTYVGATLIAIFSALTGKYLSEVGLRILDLPFVGSEKIVWRVAFVSAFIGTFTHVFLDSVMHSDVEPFFPFSNINNFQGIISLRTLHYICMASGGVGAIIYFLTLWKQKRNQ